MKTNVRIFLLFLAGGMALLSACKKDKSVQPIPSIIVQDTCVTIEDKGPYYLVTIDMTQGYSHYRIGQQYGRCIKQMRPDFEDIIGYYLYELATVEGFWGNTIPARINNIKPQLEPQYVSELDGLATQLSSAWLWSPSQLTYAYNLIPDIFRTTQCSAYGCWGTASSTGQNIAYRTLDWWGGLIDQELSTLQSITKLRYLTHSVYLIGALGHLGCITGINYTTGIMGAILDAEVGTDYSSSGRRSYNFDLRTALETMASKEAIAEYLADPSHSYTCNHLIFLADEQNCVVLENNIAQQGSHPQRGLRYDTSYLNAGIFWNFQHMIGVVNCFMLNGQVNNFSEGPNKEINPTRWNLMLQKTMEKLHNSHNKLTPELVRQIMCSYWGTEPESLLLGHGDLYNTDTEQMCLYVPAERSLKVFFKPKDNSTPKDPSSHFVTVPLSF